MLLWLQKYRPRTISEIVGNTNAVNQFADWISKRLKNDVKKAALLYGPPGVGKSLTVQVLEDMAIPFGVVVNRAGIGDRKVYDYCNDRGIPILLEIPYERRIAELYSRGIPFSLEMAEYRGRFRKLFSDVERLAGG